VVSAPAPDGSPERTQDQGIRLRLAGKDRKRTRAQTNQQLREEQHQHDCDRGLPDGAWPEEGAGSGLARRLMLVDTPAAWHRCLRVCPDECRLGHLPVARARTTPATERPIASPAT
jgi:hypothetical protein